MEWRKSAKSALQQKPQKTYKVPPSVVRFSTICEPIPPLLGGGAVRVFEVPFCYNRYFLLCMSRHIRSRISFKNKSKPRTRERRPQYRVRHLFVDYVCGKGFLDTLVK